jgi:exonuclease III
MMHNVGLRNSVNSYTSKQSQLSISSWNINGLGESFSYESGIHRLTEDTLLSDISGHDVVFLLETHCDGSDILSVEGFNCVHVNHHKVKQNGKIDGGIAVLIKQHIRKGIAILDNSNTDYIWLKLEKSYFGLEKHIYMCAAYLPHEQSLYLHNRDQDVLENIEHDIVKYSKDGYIFLLGDLNARSATLSDYIEDDSDKYCSDSEKCHYLVDVNLGARHSQDSVTNNRGQKLADLCIQCRMRIVNGRTLGDTQGYFTCHRPQGSSVVDYMILSEELLQRIQYFHVHKIRSFTDHCMVSMQMKCNVIKPIHVSEVNLKPMPQKYKWDENSIQRYQHALSDSNVQKSIADILTQTNESQKADIDGIAKQLNQAFNLAAEKSLRKTKPIMITKTKKVNKPWYDRSLQQLKRSINIKAKAFTKQPWNSTIRNSYFYSVKEYNRVRKRKMKMYKEALIQEIGNMRENSPQQYWKLLQKLKEDMHSGEKTNPADQVSPTVWYNHFRNLNCSHGNSDSVQNTAPMENPNKTINSSDICKSISEEEVMKASQSLKHKKASGLDGISNEMIKYGIHVFIKPLTNLFNLILANSHYPQIWAQGYVSPIHKSGDPLNPDNYRGITINSCLGKVLNTVLNERLGKYLLQNDIIHESQIAFKKKSRTSDHMFVIRTLIDKYVKGDKRKLYTCFVDFKKAFDSLPHNLLFLKLANYGVPDKFISLLQNMYHKGSVCVKTKGQITPEIATDRGVRQGDVLSPNLF